MSLFICQHCGSERSNNNSWRNHERLCKENPDKQKTPFREYNKTREKPWNKGLTKETSARVKEASEKSSASLRNKPRKPRSDETKRKISISRKQLFLEGKLSGKNKIKFYKDNMELVTSLYFVLFENNSESFLKIGISELGALKRFGAGYKAYSITIIKEKYLNAYVAASLEKVILKKYRKDFGYNPKNFNGRTECFSIDAKNAIIEDIEKLIEGYSGDSEDSNPKAIEFDSLITRQIKTSEEWSTEIRDRNDRKNYDRNARLRPQLAKIDFSVRGSMNKASKIIGITPQKARNFIRRNFPDLLS